MIPKRSKDLIKEYTEESGMIPAHSEWILTEYWKEVKKLLRDLDEPRVRIRGLGNFELKSSAVYNEMKRHQRLVTSVPMTRRGPHMENLERLENIYDQMKKEDQERAQRREARKMDKYGTQGENTEDLEE